MITAAHDQSISPLALKLLPNPIQKTFIMQYRSDVIADVQMSIIDLSGKIIRQWKETPNEFIFKKSYSLRDLQKGNYILQITQNGRLYSLKFIRN